MKRIISLVLMIILACLLSVCSMALPDKNFIGEPVKMGPVIRINPLYEDIVSFDELNFKFEPGYALNSDSDYYYESFESAGAYAREFLEARTSSFIIYYRTSDFDGTQESFSKICNGIVDAACAHTGESTEGDYIKWQYAGWGVMGAPYYFDGTAYYFTIPFSFSYYTTAAQEAEVTAKLAEVYEELELESKNDYHKIHAIYEYICDNVTYDYANLDNNDYKLQYTAYAALINGTSVCQGYSNLFYRMALDWDVDARLIAGLGAGGAHGWNIVKMGDYYYNLDSTWDAGEENFNWFLKCPATFDKHIRYSEYETDEFHAAYPMGASDYVYDEEDFTEGKVTVDINDDGKTDIRDAYYLRLVAAKLVELTDEQKEAFDLNGDGKVNAIDANILRKYIAGIIRELPNRSL